MDRVPGGPSSVACPVLPWVARHGAAWAALCTSPARRGAAGAAGAGAHGSTLGSSQQAGACGERACGCGQADRLSRCGLVLPWPTRTTAVGDAHLSLSDKRLVNAFVRGRVLWRGVHWDEAVGGCVFEGEGAGAESAMV